MSSIASGIDFLNSGAAAPASPPSSDLSTLDNDDFTQIILQELQQQDPFAPNDTQQLVEQISSLRNIESQQSLQGTLEALTLQSSLNQASSLLGRQVEALGGDGSTASGVVERVNVVDGEAQLRLDSGQLVPLSRVTSITENVGLGG